MKVLLKFHAVVLCLFIAACSFDGYEPNLSDKQILVLEEIEKNIRHNMEKSYVKIALEDAGIKFSKKIPYIFSGEYMDGKYQDIDAIFVDVIPADRTGCWDGMLVIIKFNTNGRVSRVIEELANFCG